MNRRTARKLLRDPSTYTSHQITVAARRVRPFWFHDGCTPPMLRHDALSDAYEDPSPAVMARLRRWRIHSQGLHDWAWREVDIPF